MVPGSGSVVWLLSRSNFCICSGNWAPFLWSSPSLSDVCPRGAQFFPIIKDVLSLVFFRQGILIKCVSISGQGGFGFQSPAARDE